MKLLGRLWTAGIAYVALAVGAGLSIMYNVVDTMAVRGALLDVYDVITAVAAPAIVILMVEMFVSRIWVGQVWQIQVIRWLATLAIGGVAMRTSWTHGHDFMIRRGQAGDVAALWPLAIDLLAIMATALILAGRRVQSPTVASGPVDGQLATELDSWDAGVDKAIGQAGQEFANEVERFVIGQPRTVPVNPGQVDIPEGAEASVLRWLTNGQQEPKGELDRKLASEHNVSTRTARRWRDQIIRTTNEENRDGEVPDQGPAGAGTA